MRKQSPFRTQIPKCHPITNNHHPTHPPQVYVIDAGKCKENGYDPNTRMQLLLERWVSRASAKQRRGRAGRVRPGRCFRMYTRQMHDDVFDEHTMPEIKRVPLEGLCLQIQLQRMSGGIAGFLGKALVSLF